MRPKADVVCRTKKVAARGLFLFLGLVIVTVVRAQNAASPTTLKFELNFPASIRATAADGRVFVIISPAKDPEPRLGISDYLTANPLFGVNVEGLQPGSVAVVGDDADGYPPAHLHDLPAGDYYVQGLLNVYTTFHRADGHTVKMHMDQWEGQHFYISPGNLYSEPVRVHLDPAAGGVVKLLLDHVIPPINVPADTEYVKHVKFQSTLLSKFWGQPIFIGATVLLPRDYEQNQSVYYPVNYEQGHFSRGAPGGFAPTAPAPANASGTATDRARLRGEFSGSWLSDNFPRMLFVTFQHPTPYYDDSYAVDSPNVGPYGQALTQELIPYIESHFRAIPKPYARILSGGSTGGWEALALQIFYPEYFGSTYSYCPDPVDFHFFQIVDIYDWPNAWYRRERFRETPLPGDRDINGVVLSTMQQQLNYERALGDHGRSGEQWDIWEAVYGPLGDDGYFKPLLNPRTGDIDKDVAGYWRNHLDLTQYLRTNWATTGPKLAGKLHIWVGDMDTYYLNDAVHLMDDFLSSTTNPSYGGTIVYGPRKPHCWAGPLTLTDRLKMMAQDVAAHAPRDVDRSWWRN